MGSIKFTKDSIEYKLFGDIWGFTRNNYIVEDSEEYWKKAIEEADAVADKYKGTSADTLASILVMAVLEYLEKKCKKQFPRYKRNEPKIDKLFRQIRFDYEDYIKDADEVDKLVLEELLIDYPDKTECKLVRKATE